MAEKQVNVAIAAAAAVLESDEEQECSKPIVNSNKCEDFYYSSQEVRDELERCTTSFSKFMKTPMKAILGFDDTFVSSKLSLATILKSRNVLSRHTALTEMEIREIAALLNAENVNSLDLLLIIACIRIFNEQNKQIVKDLATLMQEEPTPLHLPDVKLPNMKILKLDGRLCGNITDQVLNEKVYCSKQCLEEEMIIKHATWDVLHTTSPPSVVQRIVLDQNKVDSIFGLLYGFKRQVWIGSVRTPKKITFRYHATSNRIDLKAVMVKQSVTSGVATFTVQKCIKLDMTREMYEVQAWNLLLSNKNYQTSVQGCLLQVNDHKLRLFMVNRRNKLRFEFETIGLKDLHVMVNHLNKLIVNAKIATN